MAQMLVQPDIGYRSLIMSPEDFIAFVGILERSTLVDFRWMGEKSNESCYVIGKNEPQAQVFKDKRVFSEDEFQKLKKENEDE